jgi:hypothetical protein
MMVQAVSALALTAAPVGAEVVACQMATGALEFAIDRNHFAAPVDMNDPPRRAATVVQFGDATFPATPFLIGDTRGFEAEGLGGTTTLFVMQPTGEAVFSNRRAGQRITGNCTIREDVK